MHSPTLRFPFTNSSSSTIFMKKTPSTSGSDQQAVEIMAKEHPSCTNAKNDSDSISIRIQPPAESRRKQVVEETEVTGRERLKRHRAEVAGQVWIPDMWGQEKLLKDWIDCSAFDASVMNATIMSARAALAEEGRRAHSTTLRVENSC